MTIEVCNHHIYIPLLSAGIFLGLLGAYFEYTVFESHDYNFNCDKIHPEWGITDCVKTEFAFVFKLAVFVACSMVLFFQLNSRYDWFKRVECENV